MSLDGKVSIITGGGGGIGSAVAYRFAEEGAKVVVASRTENDLEKVISKIGAMGKEAIGIPTDVSSEKDVKDLVDRTVERFGTVDILVNNAGIGYRNAVVDTPLEEWKRVIDVNLSGTFLCSRAVLPHMMEQKYGKIINISSGWGKRGYPLHSAYVASKFGMAGFTESLAKEVKDYNIVVEVVFPGAVDTPITHFVSDEEFRRLGYPERDTWLKPEDIAEAVTLLAVLPNRVSVREMMVEPTTQLGTNI